MFIKILILTLALVILEKLCLCSGETDNIYKRICYYTNWAQYRSRGGKFTPDDIDPFICTHIIYAYAEMNSRHELIPSEWNDDDNGSHEGMYSKVVKLKDLNPDLKVLLAIGGYNFGVVRWSNMASTLENRRHFISTSLKYLKDRNFDGLDLNWIYPASPGPAIDRERFTLLIQELREAFDAEFNLSGKKLLLSAAVSPVDETATKGYEMAKIAKYVDWLAVLTYDLLEWNSEKAGHHSSLFAPSHQNQKLTVSYATTFWSKNGVPSYKLIVAIGAWGRPFTLSTSSTRLGSPASRYGTTAGAYTEKPGLLSYYEICDMINSGGSIVYNSMVVSPYAYKENQWVSFDDTESILRKSQWIKRNSYGGAFLWAFDLDDFSNSHCNQGVYPLLTALKIGLENEVVKRSAPTNIDTSKPNLTCPHVKESTNSKFSIVTWDVPVVVDDIDIGLSATCTPSSGSLFPVGLTDVTCSAIDEGGNEGICSFTVNLNDSSHLSIYHIITTSCFVFILLLLIYLHIRLYRLQLFTKKNSPERSSDVNAEAIRKSVNTSSSVQPTRKNLTNNSSVQAIDTYYETIEANHAINHSYLDSDF